MGPLVSTVAWLRVHELLQLFCRAAVGKVSSGGGTGKAALLGGDGCRQRRVLWSLAWSTSDPVCIIKHEQVLVITAVPPQQELTTEASAQTGVIARTQGQECS